MNYGVVYNHMKNFLLFLFGASLFGVGCSGSPLVSNITNKGNPATSTPVVVATSTLNPSGLIVPHVTPLDFSLMAWRDFSVHRAEPNAFHFQFPLNPQVTKSPNGVAEIDLGPTVSATESNASLPYASLTSVDVTSTASAVACASLSSTDPNQKISYQQIGGIDYCLVKSGDAGAGNLYEGYSYVGTVGKETVIFRFTVHSTNGCGPYYGTNTPCLVSDDAEHARDTSLFASILKTVKLGDGNR